MSCRAALIACLAGLAFGPGVALGQSGDDGPRPFSGVPADAASPFGGLSIAPTRLILEGAAATGQVNLFNSGAAPATYRIDLIELEALEAGGYGPVAAGAPADWSAAGYLRYAPRQITLAPGERQAIRVLARAPRDAAAGELRSHLSVATIPTVAPVEEDEAGAAAPEAANVVNVRVGLEYRVTIPVLLRLGAPAGGAAFRDAAVETREAARFVRATLERTGDRSDYGDVAVFDAAGEELGFIRGVAVLPPLRARTIEVPIADGAPHRIVYYDGDRDRPGTVALAEASIP